VTDRVIVVHDLAYTDTNPDPLTALGDCLVFSVEDWGQSRAMAWVYGIVVGWGDRSNDAHDELAAKFGWSAETVERLRQLHATFEAIRSQHAGGD
jgi:hypothetical protein